METTRRGGGHQGVCGARETLRANLLVAEAATQAIPTKLGLLHAYGIARDPWGMSNEIFVERTTGEVRLYDEENFRPAAMLLNLNPDYNVGLRDSLSAMGAHHPPEVPMYEKVGEHRWEIPGQGHYVVTLGDVLGPRSIQLAGSHHVESIDWDPRQI